MVPALKHGERASAPTALQALLAKINPFSKHRNGQDAPAQEMRTVLIPTSRGLERHEIPVAAESDPVREPKKPRLQLPEERGTGATSALPGASRAAVSDLQFAILDAHSHEKLLRKNNVPAAEELIETKGVAATFALFMSRKSVAEQFALLNALIPAVSEPPLLEFLQEQRLLVILKFDSAAQNPLELLGRSGLESLLKPLDAALADDVAIARLDALLPNRSSFFSKSAKQKLLVVRSSVKGLLFATDEGRLYDRLKSTVTLHTDVPAESSPLTQTGLLEALDYIPPGEKLNKPIAPAPEMEIPDSKLPKPHASDEAELGLGGLQAALKGQPAVPKGVEQPTIHETDSSASSTAYSAPAIPPPEQGGLWGALTGFTPEYALESQEPLPLPPAANESTVRRTPEFEGRSLSDILQGTPKPPPEPPAR